MMRRVWFAFCCMALATAAWAGPTGEPDSELRKLLTEAVNDTDGFKDRFVAEVWLSDMSDRMDRYVPRAVPDPASRLKFLRMLHGEATRAKVPPELVLSVIEVESRFNRYAISRSGAQGYMQIMPFWLKSIGQDGDNLFQARTNLRMGCTILKYYMDKEKGDLVKALQRYNGSYGKADYPYRVLEALSKRWFRQ